MDVALLSIVIPVYRSESTLSHLFNAISEALQGQVPFEVIFVDDGSPDGSWKKLQQLKREHPSRVVAIKFSRNFGQHNAIACGFNFAKGDVIVTMDDDLQHPPSEIIKLLNTYKETGADLVYGLYTSKQHATWRNTGSNILKASSKMIDGKNGFGSSFRLITKPIAVKVASHVQTGFLFIDEVIQWYTSNIAGIPVEHHQRRAGKSTYTGTKLLGMYFDIMINYSATPLKIMTWLGLVSSFSTFIIGVRFIYNKLVFGSTPGFTAMIVAVLFSTSILMFCMGIVGQYLYKLYQLQNKRPQFHIDTVLDS